MDDAHRMIEATLAMLRARREEKVAVVGVIAALFCDDVGEAVRRLEAVRDSARDCERSADRKERTKRRIMRDVAAYADDLIAPVAQLAKLDAKGRA